MPNLIKLARNVSLVTKTLQTKGAVSGIAEHLRSEEFDFDRRLGKAIVYSSHKSRIAILTRIKTAGWSCPVLIDTPLMGLEQSRDPENSFALEQPFRMNYRFKSRWKRAGYSKRVNAHNV